MIIFPIIITLSLVFWLYYKVAILKSKDGLTQRYFNAKSRICLGSFIFFFAINQYLFYQTQISLFIGIVLLIFGVLQLNRGLKETNHYRKEWKRLNQVEAD
ncbi:YtpI family protein [Virgibacillus doumboii]|uniref:YtpI family protein n=1 Tax=Virgibacillus doumboii TaxID=2697503 RepID=UPI0013DF4F1B|nr:YtpI family protein [Virgibacillus doumboii]